MEIRIILAGAPQGGVKACAAEFQQKTGAGWDAVIGTAPEIHDLVAASEVADIVVAPQGTIADFIASGDMVSGTEVKLGGIKTGVVVRRGAPMPNISTVAALKQAILDASSVVFNAASSGQYIATMIDQLGIVDEVADKTVRPGAAAEAMQYLAGSDIENEIGFGQMTAIRRYQDEGVMLVDALPDGVGNVTTYVAALKSGAGEETAARDFLAFLETDEARKILIANGLE